MRLYKLPIRFNRAKLHHRRANLHFETLETRRLLATLVKVTDTSSFPASATVQIVSVWDSNGNNALDTVDSHFDCSGAMISDYQVLSAGHCVFDSDEGGLADWIFAHPGRKDEFDRPFGEAQATEWTVPGSYGQNESSLYDVSIITLDRNIGRFTGSFGYTTLREPIHPRPGSSLPALPAYHHLNVSHYPSDHGYDGLTQYKGDSTEAVWPTSWITPSLPRPFFSVSMRNIWTAQGSSGAPLYLDNGQIVGVLSNGSDVPFGQSGTDHYVKLNSGALFPVSWITDTLEESSRPTDKPIIVSHDEWFNRVTSNLVVASNPHTGDTIQVKAPLWNAGTTAATNVRVRFRLSSDNSYSTSDTLLGDVVVSSIGALQSATASLTTTLPSMPRGTYHVVYSIDPDNTINEFSARLNSYSRATSSNGHHLGLSGPLTIADDSYEPNNSRNTATPLPQGSWLSSISGRGAQFNDDYYRIAVPINQLSINVSLQFQHKHGDIDLQLIDVTGSMITSSRGTADNERITTLLPASGTYYLRVHFGDGGNTYDLKWDATRAADLIVQDIQFATGTLEADQRASVSFRVANLGGASGAFRVRAMLSRDGFINPDSDLQVGTLRMSGVETTQTSSQQSLEVLLPPSGSTFWNGDGQYFIGLVVDDENSVLEVDELNNYSRGLGLDVREFQVVVHPYGTFTATTVENNRIAVPRFDSTRGTLKSVEVTFQVNGVTGAEVFPNVGPAPIVDIHPVSFTIGPFNFAGTTVPAPRFSRENHIEQIVGGLQRIFTGTQLSAFLNGAQQWAMPTNIRTGAGVGGHTHALGQMIFIVTTKFLFDPPPADLKTTSLEITNGPDFNGKDGRAVKVDYSVANSGVGPAPRFKVGFYISPDSNITTSDLLLSSYEFHRGLPADGSEQQSITLTMPHAASNFWSGDQIYYVGMIIDSASVVPETNRNNNSNLGLGLDSAEMNFVVKPRGTDVVMALETNLVTLPKFDAARGVLRQVEGLSYLTQGLTNSVGNPVAGNPLIHPHIFDFSLGPFDYVALAVPMPYGMHHSVVGLNQSRVVLTGDELQAFLAGTRTLAMNPKPVSSIEMGHAQTLETAIFLTELWYSFDLLPNLRTTGLSVVGNLVPSGRGSANFVLTNDSVGEAQHVEAQLMLVGPAGLAGPTRVLGRTQPTEHAAHSSSAQRIDYTLPALDDEFWATAGQYRVLVVVDPDNTVDEANENDNALTNLNMDFVDFQVPLRQQLGLIDLGPVGFVQRSLALTSSDQWYRVEATRTGVLTSLISHPATENVRQTAFRVPDALRSQISSLSEQTIRPYAITQSTMKDGRSRIDVEAHAGEWFIVRITGETAQATLSVANVLERTGQAVKLYGTAQADRFRVSAGAAPKLTVGALEYGLSSEVTQVTLVGSGGRDTFDIQPLERIEVVIAAEPAQVESIVIDALALMPTVLPNRIEVDQRKSISFLAGASVRMVNVPQWQNPMRSFDVNNDGQVTAIDALLIINQLNQSGPALLPALLVIGSGTDLFLDPSGDLNLSAIDALLVINHLNQKS